MATPTLDYLVGKLPHYVMHDHSVSDLGLILDARYLKLSGGTMTGGITNSTSINPLTTIAESWIGPSSTTGIYFKGGLVGIGTTGPTANLALGTDIGSQGTTEARIGVAAGANTAVFRVGQDSTHNGYLSWFANATAGNASLRLSTYGGNNPLVLQDAGGNVGIGTTSPYGKLNVIVGNSLATGATFTTSDFVVNTTGSMFGFKMGALTGNTYGVINSYTAGGSVSGDLVLQATSGNVGIGTTSPTRNLEFGGLVARTFGMGRGTVADTAGFNLTIDAGGATSAATDQNGGQLLLTGGLSTGTGTSSILLKTCPAGSTGTSDNTLATMLEVTGNKFSVFGVTAVVRPTVLTTQLTTITCSAPGTPDYAIADLTQTLPYGFASADEGQSVLKVIANLQIRLLECEQKLQALGLLT